MLPTNQYNNNPYHNQNKPADPVVYSTSYYRTGAPTPPKKPKRSNKAGYVAGILAVSLFSGAAGGGATYVLLNANQPVVAAVEEAADSSQPAAVAAESSDVESAVQNAISNDQGLAAGTTDIAAIVSKTSASVVEISTSATQVNPFFGQYSTGGSGSGVIVSEDGYIATNDHVVDGAEDITVRTQDGTEYAATLIGTDAKSDLALIKVDATGLSPVAFADSDTIEVGELAVAIGNPLGTLGGTVTNGIISAKDREITIDGQSMTLLQTSAAVNPGNSGGGLFNSQGQLIGIVNAKSSGSQVEGLGFAIPSNTVQNVIGDLMEKGYVSGRPELGITVTVITNQQAARYYGADAPGVYVTEVLRQNGFERGDRIVSLNGQDIENSEQIRDIVQSSKVGDELEAVVWRDNGPQSITVTIGEEMPESVREQIEVNQEI